MSKVGLCIDDDDELSSVTLYYIKDDKLGEEA